jgi:hypothetical protein
MQWILCFFYAFHDAKYIAHILLFLRIYIFFVAWNMLGNYPNDYYLLYVISSQTIFNVWLESYRQQFSSNILIGSWFAICGNPHMRGSRRIIRAHSRQWIWLARRIYDICYRYRVWYNVWDWGGTLHCMNLLFPQSADTNILKNYCSCTSDAQSNTTFIDEASQTSYHCTQVIW